jgi:biopolymer transport protein ExbD
MIPMIDLLMVTISFLLITAVWSHMARLNADAQVPGPPRPTEPIENTPPEKQLHIEMKSPDKFTLIWKQSGTVISTEDIPRKDVVSVEGATRVVRFPDLAAAISADWTKVGTHRDASDKKFDQAILHTDNETPYGAIIGVIDAVYQVHRPFQTGSKLDKVPAFNMTFSVN